MAPFAPNAGAGPQALRNPLYVPPVLTPNGALLTAQTAQVDLGGGQFSSALTYNGLFPGPTFRARRNDAVSVQLQNGLADPTTIHWHGMVVPHLADGHPLQAVAAGRSYSYQFPLIQRAATNWYHPHPHMLTAKEVHLGLAGFFLVEDDEEAALGLPSGAYEIPLLLRDASLDVNGQLQYIGGSGGFTGPVMLANGTRDATLDVDTALYRFRILNGSNSRVFSLNLSSGASFTLIGVDGGLLKTPATVATITLAPAERVDVVIDFRALTPGTAVMLRSGTGTTALNLLEFKVARQVSVGGVVPPVLSTFTKLLRSAAVRTRIFTFGGSTTINGKIYDMNRIDFQVPHGQVEIWRFINAATNASVVHPVHVHGASFNVDKRTGGRGQVFAWERGWKDTVYVQAGETVEVLIRFDNYLEEYLLHCHRLEHEDRGMMQNFQVI